MIRECTRKRGFHCCIALALATVISVFAQPAAPVYDLLLRGGHVLDDKNHIDGVMDVAIKDGKIARVAAHIPSDAALKTIDVNGLYVTPGLIDIRRFMCTPARGIAPLLCGRHLTVSPDGFTFPGLASPRWSMSSCTFRSLLAACNRVSR